MSHFQLSIKSLEQQVKSVSLPRNASVMELKQKIKLVFDVDTLRQRLIFQGKVLKDDKNLLDYENLDDGKVVHLVVRPIHAPHHPENDDPRRQTDSSRRTGNNGGRFSFLSNFMSNFQPSLPIITAQNSPFSPSGRSSLLSELFPTRSTTNRSSHDLFRQGGRPGRLSGLLDIMDSSSRPITLPIPSSLDMRLSRTLSYIRETRSIMDAPLSTHQVEAARTISASAIHESRQILHQHPNHASQISFVLQELANLYDACAPYLTDVRQSLAQQQQQQQSAHVLRTARIVQTLSLCHHFLGSILSCVQESDHPSSEAWTPLSTAQHASASSNISNSSNDMKRRRDDDGDAGPSSKR